MPSSQSLSSQRAKTQVKYASLVQQGKPPLRTVPNARYKKVSTKGTRAIAAKTVAAENTTRVSSRSALSNSKQARVTGYALKERDLSFLILDNAIEIILAKTREGHYSPAKDLTKKGIIIDRPVKSTNQARLLPAVETAKSNTNKVIKPSEPMSCVETKSNETPEDGATYLKKTFFASMRDKFRSSRVSSSSQQTIDTRNIAASSVTPESSLAVGGDVHETPIKSDPSLIPNHDGKLQNIKEINEEKGNSDGADEIIAESHRANIPVTTCRDDKESKEHVATTVHDEVREPCTNETTTASIHDEGREPCDHEAKTNNEVNAGLELVSKNLQEGFGETAIGKSEASKNDDNVLVCNHCKDLIRETERHLKEYPYTYADKSLLVVYHHACYQARKMIEMEKLEVDHEFMAICKTLRAAKSKSNKGGILRGNKYNQSKSRMAPTSKSRVSGAPPEQVDSLDELIYGWNVVESSEQSIREKSKRDKKTRRHEIDNQDEWSYNESPSPSYASRDYDTSSSDDDASYVEYDSEGVNTTGGEKGNRKLHRAVRQGRSERPQERSRSRSRYHREQQQRGRSQSRPKKSSSSRSEHRIDDGRQARGGRHVSSPTYRRNRFPRDKDDDDDDDRLHTDYDDDFSSAESQESFQQRSAHQGSAGTGRRHRSPITRSSREQNVGHGRRGRSPEKKRSNRGDQSAHSRTSAVSKVKEYESNRGDDRMFRRSWSPTKKVPIVSSPKSTSTRHTSVVERLKEGGDTIGSQRNSRTVAAAPVKGMSHSERGSRTVTSKVKEVKAEVRSLRGLRTLVVGGKEEVMPSTKTSRPSVVTKANKETSSQTTNSQKSSRSSSVVRSKVDVGVVASKMIGTPKKVEPKNQQAMSKMIGKPKPVMTTPKAKPTLVIRKRPKPRVTAE